MLAAADESDESGAFLMAAGTLADKAFEYKRFGLIRPILKAIKHEYVQRVVGIVLLYNFKGDARLRALTELFVVNDTGEYITTETFRMLGKTKTLTSRDFARILGHPFVESQQFAKIINALLSSQVAHEPFTRDLVYTADAFDIPALRQEMEPSLQKSFLRHFGAVPTNLDSAWLNVPLKRQDRHEGRHEELAKLILERLEAMDNVLAAEPRQLISEYAS